MEDRFYTAAIEVPGCTAREKVLLNAVLDGHGGHVRKRIISILSLYQDCPLKIMHDPDGHNIRFLSQDDSHNQRLTNRKIGEAEKCHQKTRESSQFEQF